MDDPQNTRKQYHFWPGENGLDAWDVDRLIQLSQWLPVEAVEVAAIGEVDSVYCFDELHPPTVRAVIDHVRLVNDVEPCFPIILGPDGRVRGGDDFTRFRDWVRHRGVLRVRRRGKLG